jgi:rhodanese-related sulfurtransferase
MPSEITPQDLAARLAAGAPTYLVDVRQEWEHARVAIAGSVLLPLDELPTRYRDLDPPAGALVVTYCHHGVRSLTGAALVARAGRSPVFSLSGGIDAWSLQVDPNVPRY